MVEKKAKNEHSIYAEHTGNAPRVKPFAREKMKLRLLADIRMDLMVCELEGYSKLEYLDELLALVQELKKGGWQA